MVRIWVASLHQKSSSVFITLEFFVLLVRETHKCGWIRTAAATSLKTAQKQPSGLFLAARLATSTRAHQKASTYANTLRFLFCNRARAHRAGGFEQQRSRPPPAAETGRQGWGSAPLFQSPAKRLRKKRQAQLVRPAEQPSATATTAASGRSREELLGLRPAGCTCRPRHDAAAGSRDPGSFLLCAARDIHPRPPKRCSKTTLVQTKIRVCAQKPAPGSNCCRVRAFSV